MLVATLARTIMIAFAAVIAPVLFNQLPALATAFWSRTRFEPLKLLPGADPNRVFLLFPPLWGGPYKYQWVPEYLQQYGRVIHVIRGANDRFTVRQTLRYLKRRHLIKGCIVDVVGYSMGGINLGDIAPLLRSQGARDIGSYLHAAAGDPDSIKWPQLRWLPKPVTLPLLIRLLGPGPLAKLGWIIYWCYKIHEAKQEGWTMQLLHSRWCRGMPVGAVITGARRLMKPHGLGPGDLAWIRRARILCHEDDELVGPSQFWSEVLGRPITVLPGSGHGFDQHRERIEEELAGMIDLAA